jgi:hypothetical protein
MTFWIMSINLRYQPRYSDIKIQKIITRICMIIYNFSNYLYRIPF